MATIIASESKNPAVAEIAEMVRFLEERKNSIRAEEAEYNKLRDQIRDRMIEAGITDDAISTLYGNVTLVKTYTYEYRDAEVTRQEKAVSVADKALKAVKKLLKTAQELAILNNKAKVADVTVTLRYYEPK